jgi:hypothetical protein
MAPVELDVETSLPPSRVRDALLDFSARRPEIWPGLHPTLYEVYSVEEASAEVKEGSKLPGATFWAREHYDWSDPGIIRLTVKESNFCAPGSYVAVTLRERAGGGTRVHLAWDRTGTTRAGKLAERLIRFTKGRPVASSFKQAFKKLERE